MTEETLEQQRREDRQAEDQGQGEGQGPAAPAPEAEGTAQPGGETAGEAARAGQEAGAAPEQPSPEARAEEYLDKYLRVQAEFDNFRKRMQREQTESLKYAQLPLLRELTSVMDNLERAIDHARDSDKPEHQSFVSGLEMVTKQIQDIFGRFGMQRIEAQGQPFDPNRHEAVSLMETGEYPDHTVIEVMQPGYTLHDRIVRPAMVVVSKRPAAEQAGAETGQSEESQQQ